MPFLQAALNGDRPATPRTPDEIAAAAVAAVRAGAMSLHLHAFDRDGRQTLAANACAAVLRAVRAVCPGIPLSLTTSADIEPEPRKRLELVTAWTDLPELVTANMGENGILPLCDLLDRRHAGAA